MEKQEVQHESQIGIHVGLNADKIPVTIDWASSSKDKTTGGSAKAMLLAFFDRESKDTLKIDLWTSDMQVIEMDRFFFHTLRAMADTYFKATGNSELANTMRQFVQYFGEKTESIPK